jgi:hypothetical protein
VVDVAFDRASIVPFGRVAGDYFYLFLNKSTPHDERVPIRPRFTIKKAAAMLLFDGHENRWLNHEGGIAVSDVAV